MSSSSDDFSAVTIGATTIGENLRRAIQSGAILQNEDGSFELAQRPPSSIALWLLVSGGRSPVPDCVFLNSFVFEHIYARTAVPQGCEGCYKVKVLPRSLRELVALCEIAQKIDCIAKCGLDFYNRRSQNIYAGYFYVSGLEEARATFRLLRELVDSNPKLGPDVAIVIKRGCSNYEAACGPSDKYTFRPELSQVEASLKDRFRSTKRKKPTLAAAIYGSWVPFAYQIGDETYLDFTNGRPLYPKSVTYDPHDI